jgi:putative endonuclease
LGQECEPREACRKQVIILSEWYLYMVRCCDGSLYTGISTDVGRRFAEHQGKGGTGSKYLKGKGPLILVFEQKVGTKSMALKLEGKIKKFSKEKKECLIDNSGNLENILNQPA